MTDVLLLAGRGEFAFNSVRRVSAFGDRRDLLQEARHG